MIDGYWLSTCILLAMTLGVVYFRYASRTHEGNWPMVYYGLVLLHLQLYPDGMDANVVYTAFICALLLRFEFMSGWILKLIQVMEYACLLFMAYRLFDILFV
ncbi:hypothetical protein [Bryobacter aggregatus]|uniref:hypothetical protein n=1 Tax=Bryobacter aggregatus TaxID=360054 RepID=UPI0004E17355|nr:hypothetical protein [Bryobacter aggregatus]